LRETATPSHSHYHCRRQSCQRLGSSLPKAPQSNPQRPRRGASCWKREFSSFHRRQTERKPSRNRSLRIASEVAAAQARISNPQPRLALTTRPLVCYTEDHMRIHPPGPFVPWHLDLTLLRSAAERPPVSFRFRLSVLSPRLPLIPPPLASQSPGQAIRYQIIFSPRTTHVLKLIIRALPPAARLPNTNPEHALR
jgi:hypothetical protein